MADADIEEVLPFFLMADAAVAALVDDRVYPLVIPIEAARPAIAFQRISTPEREDAFDGPVGSVTARIQLTFESTTYTDAKRLARACRRRLNGFHGEMRNGSTLIRVFSTRVRNDADGYSETTLVPVVRFDVFLQYYED